MEPNIDRKIELKDKLVSFCKANKLRIYLLIAFLLVAIIAAFLLKISSETKNNKIAEKYILAGLYLTSDKKISLNLYEEIIFSKNKFYSALALSAILEKNLVSDKIKILDYFKNIEIINTSQEQSDLISLKKALYLIKIKNLPEANLLLQNLINKNSKLKTLAEDILVK